MCPVLSEGERETHPNMFHSSEFAATRILQIFHTSLFCTVNEVSRLENLFLVVPFLLSDFPRGISIFIL